MKKISGDYLIELTNTQIVDGEKDVINLMAEADLYQKGAMMCIAYTEYDNDEPECSWNNMLRTVPGSDKVKIIRTGAFGTTVLELEKGERYLASYQTRFGEMMMGFSTSEIKSELTEDGAKVTLKYTIDCDSMLVSENSLAITVKRKGDN